MNEINSSHAVEINLRRVLKKSWILMLVFMIVFAGLGFVYGKMTSKSTYSTQTRVLVLPKETELSPYTDSQANYYLVRNYWAFVSSKDVIKQVKENLGLKITVKRLEKIIDVQTDETSIVKVKAITQKAAEKKELQKIANEAAAVAAKEFAARLDVPEPQIISPAYSVKTEKGSSPLKYAMAGGLGGFFLIFILMCLMDAADKRLYSERDVKKHLGIAVLADEGKSSQYSLGEQMLTGIEYAGQNMRSVAFMGTGEAGKIGDLAREAARKLAAEGKRVLFLDGNADGSVQTSSGELCETVVLGEALKEMGAPKDISKLKQYMNEKCAAYDAIIVSTPSLEKNMAAIRIAHACDGSVLVVEKSKTRYPDALKAEEMILSCGTQLLGAVLA